MGVAYGSSTIYQATKGIVQDGLVLNLDAGVRDSYDSGTTWRDLRGGNNGTLENNPAFDKTNGGSFIFDGANDYIDFGDIHSALNNLSIFSWVRPIALTEGPILIKGMGATGNREFGLYILSSKVYAAVGDESEQDIDSVSGATVLSSSVWYNLGMVWNGNTLKVYVNSLEDGSVSTSVTSGEIEDRSSPLIVGRDASPDYANFRLSTVKLYNRALTVTEVAQNFNVTRHRFGI